MQEFKQKEFILHERLTTAQIAQLKQIKLKIETFAQTHKNKVITLLTSGGTSVPLQKNAVRFIQNFSTGLRGSKIAETILSHDSPLIFFYRQNSFLPFQRGITLQDAFISQNPQNMNLLIQARKKLQQKANQILFLPFRSIYMYLNGIMEIKRYLPKQSIVILCAAVSDFIPSQVPTHKMTTTSEINLQLQSVPKILGKMTNQSILCVSFKLQTDPAKISERIQFALDKYNVDMVVGNMLGNKKWVHIHYNEKRFKQLSDQLSIQHQGQNIEQQIWKQIRKGHSLLFPQQKLFK